MSAPGPDDKIHPVLKIATVLDSLVAAGVSTEQALAGLRLAESAISSPATRVSLNQIIAFYRNAVRLLPAPQFAYQAGQGFHVSAYGMYGFAILSSVSYRQTMRFAVEYHRLAAPTTEISFREQDNSGVWAIAPLPHPSVDAELYRFLVELQFGIHLSLHRDVMGPSFTPKELLVTYRPPSGGSDAYAAAFECNVVFGQPENQFIFDAGWMDRAPPLGNRVTYSSLARLCDQLLEELRLNVGLPGKVREILLVNLVRPTSFDAVAKHLAMTPRTLRRRLLEENTSYRRLIDELRMEIAIKYLRDTALTIDEIAGSLGFSDAANFRHAFRRWTGKAPQEFRQASGELRQA